jgi:hypothetical protein
MIDKQFLQTLKTRQITPRTSRTGLSPAEAEDLEQLGALIDGHGSLLDLDEATLERLIAAFGLDELTRILGP